MLAKTRLVLGAMLIAAPLTSPAQDAGNDLSYTYFEGDWVILDIDTFDDDGNLVEDVDDGDGWALQGSFAFTPMFFGYAAYASTEADASFSDPNNFLIPGNVDVTRLDAGLGFNMPLDFGTRDTDLVVKAAYVDVDFDEFDFGGTSNNDLADLDEDSSDGWTADARIRSQLTPWLEGSIGAGYIDLEDTDTFSGVGNLMVELTPNWGINLAANVGDEVSTYGLGVRYSFNRF
jgi:hypothetical protein